jgi:aldehyde dehydrogenase (NAD+)
VITGGIEVGRALTTDPRVDVVTFTGSDKVGREVDGPGSGGLKKVVLELGGKSANVILDDADLDDPLFVPSALAGFITHAGQACAATTPSWCTARSMTTSRRASRQRCLSIKSGMPQIPMYRLAR